MKAELIGQIEAIYRDLGHTRRGKPLSEFTEAELRRHLESLSYGIEWVKGGKKAKVGRPEQNPPRAGAQDLHLPEENSPESGTADPKISPNPPLSKEQIQAFDHARDEQGLLHFALLDMVTGIIITEVSPIAAPGSLDGRIGKAIIDFLERSWGNQPPTALLMDSEKLRTSVLEYLASKGITRVLFGPADTDLRGKLERVLYRSAGETPAPPQKSV